VNRLQSNLCALGNEDEKYDQRGQTDPGHDHDHAHDHDQYYQDHDQHGQLGGGGKSDECKDGMDGNNGKDWPC
jgi:hypothetical protein